MEHALIKDIPLPDPGVRPRTLRAGRSLRSFCFSMIGHASLLVVMAGGVAFQSEPEPEHPAPQVIHAALYTPSIRMKTSPVVVPPAVKTSPEVVTKNATARAESIGNRQVNEKASRLDAMLDSLANRQDRLPDAVPGEALRYEDSGPIDVRSVIANAESKAKVLAPEPVVQPSDTPPIPPVESPVSDIAQVDSLLAHQLAIAEKIKSYLRVPITEVTGCDVMLKLSLDGTVLNASAEGGADKERCQHVVKAAFRASWVPVPKDPALQPYLKRLRVTVR